MPIDSTRYQTIVLSKKQIANVRRLSKKSRYPMTTVISYAITRLLNDPEAVAKLVKGEIEREVA